MRKLYENFHIFHFQKQIVSAETIRGNTVHSITFDSHINPIKPRMFELLSTLSGAPGISAQLGSKNFKT